MNFSNFFLLLFHFGFAQESCELKLIRVEAQYAAAVERIIFLQNLVSSGGTRENDQTVAKMVNELKSEISEIKSTNENLAAENGQIKKELADIKEKVRENSKTGELLESRANSTDKRYPLEISEKYS